MRASLHSLVLLLGLCSALRASALQSDVPIVEWVSSPVRPGELLLVNGGGFEPGTSVELTWSGNVSSTTVPVSGLSDSTLTIEIPAASPFGVFDLVVCAPGGARSEPFAVNQAEAWWFLGDNGNTSTPGGWVRVFGKNLLLEREAGARRAAVRDSMSLAAAGDFAGAQQQWAHRQAAWDRNGVGTVTLRLTPANTAAASSRSPPVAVELYAVSSAVTTEFSAQFSLPPTLAAGEYTATIKGSAQGAAFVPVAFLQSTMPGFPDVSFRNTLVVAPPLRWPTTVFPIAAPAALPPAAGYAADDAVASALAAAKKNGGGVVQFAAGKYLLRRPILVPDKVVVRGMGQSATSLFFASVGNRTADAPTAYLIAEGAELSPNVVGYTGWKLHALSIYVSGAHNDVVSVTNTTLGFEMINVTIRANALFAAPHGVGIGGTRGAPYWQTQPNQDADGRQIGPAVRIHGVNFVVDNCDIYATASVLESQNSFNGTHPSFTGDAGTAWTQVHGSFWGRITNNKLYNGAGCSHRMNNWNQILFENNTVVGVGPIAMGQALGTGPVGGISSHVFHHNNQIQFVWGNDREVMTLDDAGGCYFGPVEVSGNGTELTLAWDPIPGGHEVGGGFGPLPTPGTPVATNGWAGAEVVVLNGTGAGQTRRVVVPGLRYQFTPENRTWVIDRPFAVPLAPDSWVQIQPYRGRIHFIGNDYRDTGAVQTYGHVSELVLAENRGERMVGFILWGQWRGYFHPERGNSSLLGGAFGVGANPNLKMLVLNNTHLDQGIVNFATEEIAAPGDGQSSWWTPDKIHGCPFTVRDSPYGQEGGKWPGEPYPNLPDPKPALSMNSLTVLRGNEIEAAGSIWVGWYAANTIVESNSLMGGDAAVFVANTTLTGVTVRGNTDNQ